MMNQDEFRRLVFQVRYYQKKYKETGNKHHLISLIDLEKRVDQELILLEKERLGVPKKPQVSDLFSDLK